MGICYISRFLEMVIVNYLNPSSENSIHLYLFLGKLISTILEKRLIIYLDLLLLFLEFDFPLFRLEFLSFPLPLLSTFKAKLDDDALTESILRTSSARIQSLTLLKFNFILPIKLLTTTLIGSQLCGRDAKRIRA